MNRVEEAKPLMYIIEKRVHCTLRYYF